MKVLIAGANGFLGNTLTRKCIDKGWSVDALINKSSGNIDNRVGKIVTANALNNCATDYDYVFNVAAHIPYGKYNDITGQLIVSNIDLPLKLHQKFSQSKIVFASSVSVYGSSDGLLNENSDIVNPTKYGISKLTGEMITALHDKYSIVRFSSLYGNGMYKGTFIPNILNDAMSKGHVNLLGKGLRKQNYIHVSDAAGYCINAALSGDNDVYLGTSAKSYENREVAEIVSSLTGCMINYINDDFSPSFEYDNKKTREKLNFTPRISLDEGIKQMIDG
jgi:UDP-glucose 4-epimerase